MVGKADKGYMREKDRELIYPIVLKCWKCKKDYSKKEFHLEDYCSECFRKILNREHLFSGRKKK